MDTYDKNLNACLLHRNKQLTRQLKDYQQTLALTDCSSSLMLAMGQLLRLHRLPSYGLVTSEEEWCHLFAVIDMILWWVFVSRLGFLSIEYSGVENCANFSSCPDLGAIKNNFDPFLNNSPICVEG